MINRAWAWLLARPKPREPAPRIVTLATITVCASIYAASFALPVATAIHVMNIILAIGFSAAFLAVAFFASRMMFSRRRRTR